MVVLAWLLTGTPASAREDAAVPHITEVSCGIGGRFRLGAWTPVFVTLQGGAAADQARAVLSVLDGEELVCRYSDPEAAIDIPAGESTQIVRYVRFGRQNAQLRIALNLRNGPTQTFTVPPSQLARGILTSQPVIAVLGADPGFRRAASRLDQKTVERIELLQVDPEQMPLPDAWIGFQSVDVVYVSGSSAGSISEKTIAALNRWVAMGGRLIFSAGGNTEQLFSQQPRWLEQLPGPYTRTVSLRRLGGLERYLAAQEPISFADEGIQVASLEPGTGVVRVFEGVGRQRQAVWTQHAHGFGHVVFLAFDLGRQEFREWEGTQRLLNRLIAETLGVKPDRDAFQKRGRAAHLGFRDLSGQLRAALDVFPNVHVLPAFAIGIVALAYIALIGPLDYLLLTRWLKTPTATWITFPLIVVSFCALPYWISQTLRGQQWSTNEVHVIDVDAVTGLKRGTSWMHLYSPENGVVNVSLDGDARNLDRIATWQGLPGDGFGGMNTAARGFLAADGYDHPVQLVAPESNLGAQAELIAYPIRAGASRSFLGRWTTQDDAPRSSALTADAYGLLHGTLVNESGLPLENCWLCHQRWVYRIVGTFAAGASVDVDSLGSPRGLESVLVRRRRWAEDKKDTKEISTPWNRSSTDVPRILQMMMFHAAAGGNAYTDLLHRTTGNMDLSDHLSLDRAVLVGETDQVPVTWSVSGSPTAAQPEGNWSRCRLILPVTLAGPSSPTE